MSTLSISETKLPYPHQSTPACPGPPYAATVVAALYVLLVLGAPWIVRYAPSHEARVVEQLAERPALMRCASAPEYGLPCGSEVPAPGVGQRRAV